MAKRDLLYMGLQTEKLSSKQKWNLNHTCSITPKRETSGGVTSAAEHLGNSAPKKRRIGGDTASDLTEPRFQPQISHTDSNLLTTELTNSNRFFSFLPHESFAWANENRFS